MIEFDTNCYRRFRRSLLKWYEQNARDLPWRQTSNAYRIWISEIMLQQTTVAAVIPYYRRFLKRFPTIRKLAAASEDEVLRLWEGLGYYSRARNIHKTAKRIVEHFRGQFPDDVAELQELPGIGRYTAGAIASFAYDRKAPIVEANTLRLYSRLLGYEEDPRSRDGQRLLWDFAERVLPRKAPGKFNQALMELGATVCTQPEPNCSGCPVKSCCDAFANGLQREIPVASRRPEITSLVEAAVAIVRGKRFLLRRCADGERWAGLWDFPRFSLENGLSLPGRSRKISLKVRRFLEQQLQETFGVKARIDRLLTDLTHGVTRYRIRLFCFLAETDSLNFDPTANICWVNPADFGNYPLSTTGRKFANLLTELDF